MYGYGVVNKHDVKGLREKLGITQAVMAKALEVHVLTVSKWERGATQPDGWRYPSVKEMENKVIEGMRTKKKKKKGARR